MSTKELALETIRKLPVDASWAQIGERIRFMAGVETARTGLQRGDVIPHGEVSELLSEWISK